MAQKQRDTASQKAELAVFGFVRSVENVFITPMTHEIPMDIKTLMVSWCLTDLKLRQNAQDLAKAAIKYVFTHRRKESLNEKLLHCFICHTFKLEETMMQCPKCETCVHEKCMEASFELEINGIYHCPYVVYDYRSWDWKKQQYNSYKCNHPLL